MILAAIDWLTISIDLLIGVFVLVCLVMSLLILMQRPKNEGLGAAFGSGTTDQLFGARTTNVLQRGTVYLATLFFVLALALAILIGQKNKRGGSLVKEEAAPAAEEVVTGETPEAPAAETVEGTTEPVAEEKPLEPEPVVNPETEEQPPAEEPAREESPEPAPTETPAQEPGQEEAPPAEEPSTEEP